MGYMVSRFRQYGRVIDRLIMKVDGRKAFRFWVNLNARKYFELQNRQYAILQSLG